MKRKRSVSESFKNAWWGLKTIFTEGRNIKIQCCIGLIAVLLCIFLPVTQLEWIVILLCCMVVLSLECMNSALEQVVDLASPKFHMLAKRAKDFAAGAVLLASLFSVIIGGMIFIPYFIQLLG